MSTHHMVTRSSMATRSPVVAARADTHHEHPEPDPSDELSIETLRDYIKMLEEYRDYLEVLTERRKQLRQYKKMIERHRRFLEMRRRRHENRERVREFLVSLVYKGVLPPQK